MKMFTLSLLLNKVEYGMLKSVDITSASGGNRVNGRTRRKEQRGGTQARAVGMRILKIIYIALFSVSALIVAAYCIMNFVIRAPEVENPPVERPPVSTEDPGNEGGSGEIGAEIVPERRKKVYTCLIFGLDKGNGNTDTIMVASFDVPNKKIGLMSIPRDTVVSKDRSAAQNKINAAYSRNGVEELDAELEELLGIPIDYYVKIKLSAFKKLVNAVGGVWFDVPVKMDYDDPVQELSIHLEKGYQLLNGEQAMGLVRYRQNNEHVGYGDVGRANTQQAFMTAMLSQVLSGADLDSVPELVDILLNYVETDASLNDMLYFGRELLGLDLSSGMKTGTLPGEWHSPYIWVQSEEALSMINELLNPYTTEITPDMVEFFER